MTRMLKAAVAAIVIVGLAQIAFAADEVDGDAPKPPWAVIKLRQAKADFIADIKAADTDGDGVLSVAEAKAAKKSGVFDPGGWGLGGFKHADKNKDGKLSPAEIKGEIHARLVKIRKALFEYDQRLRKKLTLPGVDARERYQYIRIRNGIANGSLTPAEAKALIAGERTIRKLEFQAKSDGKVTPAERAELHKALNRMSGAIYKEKHDDEGKKLPKPPPGATPGVKVRQGIQKGRIGQGVKSGELTKGETKALIGGQKKIQHMKHDMKADGKVTIKERKILHHAQNKQSHKIFRLKHNDNSRPTPKPRVKPKPKPRPRPKVRPKPRPRPRRR